MTMMVLGLACMTLSRRMLRLYSMMSIVTMGIVMMGIVMMGIVRSQEVSYQIPPVSCRRTGERQGVPDQQHADQQLGAGREAAQ